MMRDFNGENSEQRSTMLESNGIGFSVWDFVYVPKSALTEADGDGQDSILEMLHAAVEKWSSNACMGEGKYCVQNSSDE